MKTFIIRDFQIQRVLVIILVIAGIVDLIYQLGFSLVLYFLIAAAHLISMNVKFFTKSYSNSYSFKFYYSISMTFMVLLIMMFFMNNFILVQEFGYFILYFGLFCTPIMAIIYFVMCYNEYKIYKNFNN